jgi:hypothetical protein
MNLAVATAWVAIPVALILACLIVRDEIVGETQIPKGRRNFDRTTVRVYKSESPERFREIITSRWYMVCACLGGGVLMLVIARRADRLDPFSPHFAGNQALDDLGDTLRKKEEEIKAAKKRTKE